MSILLNKENAGRNNPADLDNVTKFKIGVSWDPSARGRGGLFGKASQLGGCDLDLFAVLMTNGDPKKLVSGLTKDLMNPFRGKDGDGCIQHSGDEKRGNKKGDDEAIEVNFPLMPERYDTVVFMVANFKGVASAIAGDNAFQGADNVEFTGYDLSSGGEVEDFKIEPSLLGTKNCCLVSKAMRPAYPGGPWRMAILEEFVHVIPKDQRDLLMKAKSAA